MTDKEFLDYCKDIKEWENVSLKNNLSFSFPLFPIFDGKIYPDNIMGRYSSDYMSAWFYPDIVVRNITLESAHDFYLEKIKAKQ